MKAERMAQMDDLSVPAFNFKRASRESLREPLNGTIRRNVLKHRSQGLSGAF